MYLPLFLPLRAETRANFLFPADYLIQQPCGSTLCFPCNVSVNVHRGTYIGVSEKFLHIFGGCPVVANAAAYCKILLAKVNVLPSQSADLSNAKSRVVSNLNGQHEIKIAARSVFFDETGKRVRTKKEIMGEDGKIRDGCTVIKKGEVYESHLFLLKNDRFKSEPFLREVKEVIQTLSTATFPTPNSI